jgi:hypothetical protein
MDSEAKPSDQTDGARRRPPRLMPYSAKEHPEHEGAVSLVRSAGVATDWEFRQLCERFPEKVVAGMLDLLKTERGRQIAALIKLKMEEADK